MNTWTYNFSVAGVLVEITVGNLNMAGQAVDLAQVEAAVTRADGATYETEDRRLMALAQAAHDATLRGCAVAVTEALPHQVGKRTARIGSKVLL